MSVVRVGVEPPPRVGPRSAAQQAAAFKWSMQLTGSGYWLYFGAPACVVSSDASRAELLREDETEKVSLAGAVAARAKRIVEQANAPASLKVYYQAYSSGDVQPAPQLPEVRGTDGKTRDPTEAENEFALYCARELPQYDVTLRADERKYAWLKPGAARPLNALPNVSLPKNFSSAPFGLPWEGISRANAQRFKPEMLPSLEQKFTRQMHVEELLIGTTGADFVAGRIGRRGYLVLSERPGSMPAPEDLIVDFNDIVAFDIKSKARGEIVATLLAFCSGSPDDYGNAQAVFRVRRGASGEPLPGSTLEIRTRPDGLLKRVPFRFGAVMHVASAPATANPPSIGFREAKAATLPLLDAARRRASAARRSVSATAKGVLADLRDAGASTDAFLRERAEVMAGRALGATIVVTAAAITSPIWVPIGAPVLIIAAMVTVFFKNVTGA